MDDFKRLSDRVARLERLRPTEGAGEATDLGAIVPPGSELARPPAPSAGPPAAHQRRNGDASHSVNTWFEAVAAPGTDKVLECAWWFVHDVPAAGQALTFVDARTNSVNSTLKAVGHSQYNAQYPDWGVSE